MKLREIINEIIKHEGNKWILYNHLGTKILGRHPTRASALRQERAIQYWKHHH